MTTTDETREPAGAAAPKAEPPTKAWCNDYDRWVVAAVGAEPKEYKGVEVRGRPR